MKNKKTLLIITFLCIVVILGVLYFFVFRKIDVTGIKLVQNNIKMFVEDNVKLEVQIEPDNATDKRVKWESNNNLIATVTEDGIVTGKTPGDTVIKVSTFDGKLSDECMVKVISNKILDIGVSETNIKLSVGETRKIDVTITPIELQDRKLTWESSDPSVVLVTEDGTITGIKEGKADIKVSGDGVGKVITVESIVPVSNITISDSKLNLKTSESKTLSYVISPETATNKNVTWSSSDNNIAKVDNGVVTGVNEGETIITVTSSDGDYKASCTVTVIKIKIYSINYKDLNQIVQKEEGQTIGNMPTPTKTGYKFTGWYTSVSGGTQIKEDTTVTNNMDLYAHWEKELVLPDEFTLGSKFSALTGKTYISDTLKYKTITDNQRHYYSLIWVKDAYHQLNSANNNLSGGQRSSILNEEIKSFKYQEKGMIATNGSFSSGRRSNTIVIASKGVNTVNNIYNTADNYYYSTLGLSKNGWLINYKTRDASALQAWITNNGVRNTWAITHFNDSNWNGGRKDGADHRTSICQVDEHNFVLYVGYSTGIEDYMKELHDTFGCKIAINLDGGGSTGMYYKTKSTSNIGTVYEYKRPNDCCRTIGDMLYFVE